MHGQQNIKKKTEIPVFMNIRPVGAELFRVDRQTDGHDETNNHLSQFYERT